MMKKMKMGVFGAGRGMDVAKNFMLLGVDIVALCDFNQERLKWGAGKVTQDIALYDDFDAFLEHEMDAVIIANYFHEHAPYAIKCMQKGIHVYSECISNGTMAEGIKLIDAFEKSNSIYMLAENYPQRKYTREMKKICEGGSLGKIIYAEGEYNHPVSPNDTKFNQQYVYRLDHWRNFNPRGYYITHSLGPIMWITGATPKRVSSFASFAPIQGDEKPTVSHVGDRVAIVTTQNDDGSIFRVTGCASFGAHHNSYRVCGTEGQIENLRGMGEKVMLRYNEWSKPEYAAEESLYEPSWNDPEEEIIKTSGHGGGDYLTCRMFVDCIKKGVQPEHPFDIYSAVNMSSVAILSHRSMLEGGKPYDIPDFTKEEDRKLYENDYLTPYYGSDGSAPTLPCCSVTDYKPTEKQIDHYKEQIGIE